MKQYLLVDGYNIINSWNNLIEESKLSLEAARWKLIEIMVEYQTYKDISVIIVFDAHYVKNSIEKHEFYNDLEIVFTRELESADNYIERYVASLPKDYNVKVATSDMTEQFLVLGLGAARVSARELKSEVIEMKRSMAEDYINRNEYNKNLLGHSLDLNILQKLEKLRRNNDKA